MKPTAALTVALSALSAFASGCGGGSGGDSAPPTATAAMAPSDPSSAAPSAAVTAEAAASVPLAAASAASSAAAAASEAAPAVSPETEPSVRALGTTTATDSGTKTSASTTTATATTKPATTTASTSNGATTGTSAAFVVPTATAPNVQAEAAPSEPTAKALSAAEVVAADFSVLTSRMRAEYRGLSAWQADTAIPSLNAKGEWADVNYDDRGMGEWKPMAHLERVRAMAIVYSAASGKYARSTAVRDGIFRALRAWVARNPQSDNWWHNTIGEQLVLMPILVLMDAEMPADLRSSLLASFVPIASVPADRKTGQNLVWYTMQSIVKGALSRNSVDIALGRDALRSTLPITTSEGLQADLSFHQHGNQLYSGGYGLTYLIDMVHMADWLKGTAWAFTNNDVNLLADLAIVGIAPLVRGDWLDWGARGREVTRQEPIPRATLLRAPVASLATLAPDRSTALSALLSRLTTGAAPAQVSTIGYWRSDFLGHQTPKGYFSVKMVSKRTIGTESGNGENLLGYWLPFGSTFIVGNQRGNEYLGLQPLLDWSALPGTTAPTDLIPSFTGYLRHSEEKIAVLNDANNGMASMQVNTQGLLAKKFWFVDGEMMVALGSDIRYTGTQRVRTTINQTRWMGTAASNVASLSSSAGSASQSSVKWLAHAGVGYVVLDGQSASLNVNERKLTGDDPTASSFGALAAKAKATQLMTLVIDHGTKPQGANYAYAVIHGVANATQVQAVARPKVLANTALVQGVMSADGSRLAAAFHKAGTLSLGNNVTLQADQPVAVLGQIVGSQLQVQVIDLAGTGATIVLKTLKDSAVVDQKTVTAPSNTKRTRQTPAVSTSLAIAR